MDIPTSWTTEPHAAYLDWQATEAAGADRRRFSQRSIIQHKAMFDRFL
ncbi:site-specific integrase, partial [Paraburkholderia sediminicola]